MSKIEQKVVKCNLDGTIVSEFKTAIEAGNEIGVSKYVIYRACKKPNKIIKGFRYKYIDVYIETPEIIKNIKCPYCDRTFDTFNGLAKHVIKGKMHGEISQEKLLSDFKYGGERPLCKCGCGGFTDINYEGGAHFNDYVKGHYSRVHNNWGHNKKAMENSAKTRRKRFESGEIIQWNKGKSWNETYNEKQIEELKKVYQNEERNNKISEKMKKIFMERIKNQSFSISSKTETKFAKKYLDELDIKYETQKYIKEINQFVDYYIPEIDMFLEFDGNYWHCNPEDYPNGAINKIQENKIEKDNIKNQWMKDNNKKLIRIWESDFENDEEKVWKQLEIFKNVKPTNGILIIPFINNEINILNNYTLNENNLTFNYSFGNSASKDLLKWLRTNTNAGYYKRNVTFIEKNSKTGEELKKYILTNSHFNLKEFSFSDNYNKDELHSKLNLKLHFDSIIEI